MKKPITQTLGDLLAGRGFYIVLTLCAAVVGVSGWYLLRGVSPTPNQPVGGTTLVESPSPSPSALPSPSAPAVTAKPSPSPVPSPSVTPAPSPSAEAWGKEVFTWPVKGQVISGFSLEVLAYDETMGDWRTHQGIDIAAEVGAKVKAANAGTVTAVYQDDLMGSVVTMAHEDGLTSLYANLGAEPNVKAGDTLDTGAVLGVVGETAIAEVSRPAHLHFELTKDGVGVDPENYLPKT